MKLLRTFEKFYIVVSMLFLTNGIIQKAIAESDVAGRRPPCQRIALGSYWCA